jgi:flagellar hook-associated protein 3 FlgL
VRITANRMLELAGQAAGRAQSDVATLAGQVTSGTRVERPSDDPLAWAHARRLALREAISDGRGEALGFGQDQLAETDRALRSIGDITAEAKQLALEASNASLNAADRSAMEERVRSLFELARTAANTRSSSGEYLLAGAQGDQEPFDAAGAYRGDGGVRALEGGEANTITASLPGTALTAAGGVDVLPALVRFAAALGRNDLAGIQTAIDEMSTAHVQVDKARTAVGSMSAVLADADGARGELEANLQARIASLTEIDIVTAASELAQRSRALEAAQAVNGKLASLLQPR